MQSAAQVEATAGEVRARSLRFRKVPLSPGVPIAVLTLIVLLAIAAPLLTGYSPVRQDLGSALLEPSWVGEGTAAHLLGTDNFGRDVFTRLLYGARVSMAVGFFSMVIAVVIGTFVGIVAGYAGGWTDSLLMRLTDIMLALPTLLVGLVVAIVIGPSFWNLIILLGVLSWPRIARLLRGETLALRQTDFVRYARAIGVGKRVIRLRHVLPNILPTLLVATTLELGSVILTEASLSFLGAGIPPPQASWGTMIADGQGRIATGWWIGLFPGLALGTTVLSTNALGDWMRDHFDPRARKR
jgi:peptide/nickel transport system permease protein